MRCQIEDNQQIGTALDIYKRSASFNKNFPIFLFLHIGDTVGFGQAWKKLPSLQIWSLVLLFVRYCFTLGMASRKFLQIKLLPTYTQVIFVENFKHNKKVNQGDNLFRQKCIRKVLFSFRAATFARNFLLSFSSIRCSCLYHFLTVLLSNIRVYRKDCRFL